MSLNEKTLCQRLRHLENSGFDIKSIKRNLCERLPADSDSVDRIVQLAKINNIPKSVFEQNPRLFSFSPSAILERINYLDSVGICRDVFNTVPSILNLSVDNNLNEKIKFLKDNMIEVKCVNKAPSLLTIPIPVLEDKLNYFLDIDISSDEINKNPIILCLSLEDNIKPKVEYFQNKGIPLSSLKKVQSLWCMSIKNIEQKVDYITKLGLSMDSIKKYPRILTASIEYKLKPNVEFFVSNGFFLRSLDNFPMLLNASLETLKKKLSYYLDLGLGIETIHNKICLFTYSLENNIIPKVKFIENLGYNAEIFDSRPDLLCYSLKNRIMPRVEFLHSKNLPDDLLKHISKTDKKFCEFYKYSLEQYVKFKDSYLSPERT